MNAIVSPTPPASPVRRCVSACKPLFIGVLALLLLIPLSMVRSLLSERQSRRFDAVANITGTWGESQTLIGPVLVVPYRIPVKTRREQRVEDQIKSVEEISWSTAHACFLPTNLNVVGSLDPSILHRGIYEAAVYRGTFSLTGRGRSRRPISVNGRSIRPTSCGTKRSSWSPYPIPGAFRTRSSCDSARRR